MRKLLWVVAVVAIVLTVAAPAMALDFKFGAEYRVRFYDYGNVTFDSDNNAKAGGGNFGTVQNRGNPRGVQIRIRPRFDVSDDNGNITATMRFEWGDTEWGAGGGANSSSFGSNTGQISIDPSGSNRRVGNGAGGSIGADGVGLETKWAYIDFLMPFGIPLRIRAGTQPWYLPKGLVIDDDITGIRAYGTVKPVSYEGFFYRAARGNATRSPGTIGVVCNIAGGSFVASSAAGCTGAGGVVSTSANNSLFADGQGGVDTTRDNALDYYGGRFDVAIASWLNPGAYFVYGDNRMNCAGNANAPPTTCNDRVREQWFAGFTATGKIGIVDYDFDFVYGSTKGGITGTLGTGGINTTGDINNPITVKGWVADAGVHIPVGPLKFNILGSYATGDKQDGGDSEAFPLGPGPSWSGAGGQYELIGEGGAFDVVSFTQHGPTNLWMAGLTVEYVPVKALWIKLAYGYIGFSSKAGNCGNTVTGSTGCFGPIYTGKPTDPIANLSGFGGKAQLGQEIHIRADYTIWTGFKVQGMAGWLIPTAGDTASKYILQLYYNF